MFLFKNIFAEQEFEYNNYSQPIGINANNNLVYGHAGFPALFVGGGLYQPISGNAGFTMMVLYDLIQDPHSYYNSPLSIRGGINFGFSEALKKGTDYIYVLNSDTIVEKDFLNLHTEEYNHNRKPC